MHDEPPPSIADAAFTKAWRELIDSSRVDEEDVLNWLRERERERTGKHTLVDLVRPTPVPLSVGGEGAPGAPTSTDVGGGRYKDLGRLGIGGMGEVRRVFDRRLNRRVAMKVLRKDTENVRTLHRFIEEAQATAQLQHPGVVPTYELGELDDGRPYFTMKEVQGNTLEELIRAVHGSKDQLGPDQRPWNTTRLVDALLRVCDAMAFAHARSVVHRDLKPSNIMAGAFGEVLVMDWGLAKILTADDDKETGPSEAPEAPEEEAVVTDRSRASALATRMGAVVGTPAYMAPEQATAGRISTSTDVYALGAVLYEILEGKPAFPEESLESLIQAKVGAPPPVPMGRPGRPVPEELRNICVKSMDPDPVRRYPSARELAIEIGTWLDGEKRRARARRVVEEARSLLPELRSLRDEAKQLVVQAAAMLRDVPPTAPVARKRVAWDLEDRASVLAQEAEVKTELYVQTLQTALNHDPELEEAHNLLAEHYRGLHEDSERRGDRLAATRLETSLRFHDRGGHTAYLRGDGALSLVTEPTGASVDLYRVVERDRRRAPEFVRHLGRTPIREVELRRGSYVLRIRSPGRTPVMYPVYIEREQHWDGIRPGEAAPTPVYLPPTEELGIDDVYVPAGWAIVGGDMEAIDPLPRARVWVDGFVMKRFPITNSEYLRFLNSLVDRGQVDEALKFAPRERGGGADEFGPLIYARRKDGHFGLRADADGDVWELDWPVLMIDWYGAMAYADWQSGPGRRWRLPSELEREKAARGVDGRFVPWGDVLDPTFCCMRESHTRRWMPHRVDSFPVDESVFGIRGLAGNVNDWCLDLYDPLLRPEDGSIARVLRPEDGDEQPRVHRGGRWSGTAKAARSATRMSSDAKVRTSALGARLARPLG